MILGGPVYKSAHKDSENKHSLLCRISYGQTLSKCFDSLQTFPDSLAATNPFSSDVQSRRNLIVLVQRFLLTFFALVLLVVCLWGFPKMQPMSQWQQRFFNTLSILLTAVASLGLGSLLGHLGSMLRWPLLARTVYQMQDVDSILGMSTPTGTLQLIRRHIREWRISRTTFIATAYLIINVVGRLSVAIFGLAYNMTDKTGVEVPILGTDWKSASWTSQNFSDGSIHTGGDEDQSEDELLKLALNGLQKYANTPKWAYSGNSDFSFGDDINPYLPSDLHVSNATLKVGG
ncbi:hypothetical protein C7212DRAFT_353404 [Tuber magnatum]|uniref:Uncharacterized protein n=1 Tax=Tuber magnatum TaxID=42249 RepID=A0A317SKE4_9PEZI|nr:hypothetical protein C7212DRAFT_353404 [Tuber magnatum]